MTDLIFPLQGDTAEYWATPPTGKELARDIAALANTKGGHLFIGCQHRLGGKIAPTGLTDRHIKIFDKLLQEMHLLLTPMPQISNYITDIYGKPIYVIEVHKSPAPVLFPDGRYYIRRSDRSTLAEHDLIEALSEAVPSIKPNILTSLEAEKAIIAPKISAENFEQLASVPEMSDKYTQVIRKKVEEKPYLDLTELLSESIQRTRDDLTTQRNERLQQARITFIVALVVLVLAIILVFVGVILIFTNKTQEGVVTSVASIVSSIVSGLALTLNKQTNDRMDEYAKELVILEKSYTAMQYISLITDLKMKNEAIRDLANSISLGDQASK